VDQQRLRRRLPLRGRRGGGRTCARPCAGSGRHRDAPRDRGRLRPATVVAARGRSGVHEAVEHRTLRGLASSRGHR
jgi:hypothetical protein